MSKSEATAGDASQAKAAQWPVLMLQGLIADKVHSRLGPDAFALACCLVERQDRLWGKPVRLFISQLAEFCGESPVNPRRTRAARAALREDGWLKFETPKNGERAEVAYQMVLKTTHNKSVVGKQSTSNKSVVGEHLTHNETVVGEGFTPNKSVAAPTTNLLRHPQQICCTSDPSITDPRFSDPPYNPLNPPEGETADDGSFEVSAEMNLQEPFALEAKPEKVKKQSSVVSQAEEIYRAYPRHVGPAKARAAIAKALKTVQFDRLLERVKAYAAAVKTSGMDPDFIPYPAKWFNQGRWDDDEREWTRNAGTTGKRSGGLFDSQFSWAAKRGLVVGAGQTYDGSAPDDHGM